MEQYKKDFITFMVESKVLTFGDFTTKSGRKTPFFINTGKYKTGEQIKKLGFFYAEAIAAHFPDTINVLFGPAYKGIPLVITTAIALIDKGRNVSFCFNRKEAKDHGEGGNLIGHSLQDNDNVLIVEDVTTAGTSVRETIPLLQKNAAVSIAGLIVSVDRMEKGQGSKSALTELREQFNMPTQAIVTLDDIVAFLHNKTINGNIIITDTIKQNIDRYRELYGANE